jgi:hypothetical protein
MRRLATATFLVGAIAFAMPRSGAAQTPQPPTPLNGVVFAFERTADHYGDLLVQAFGSIPVPRYAYSPTPAQQSVGYIAQHLEGANYVLCERLGGAKRSTTAKDSLADTVKARWPKDTLVARLRASLAFCDVAIERLPSVDGPTVARSLLLFETDLAEHYAQLSGYMRQMGLVPPSALPRPHRTAIALPAASLARYTGTYRVAQGLDLAVTQRDTTLWVQSTGGSVVRLWPESADNFFVTEVDLQLTFTRDASGTVSGVIVHQDAHDWLAPRAER